MTIFLQRNTGLVAFPYLLKFTVSSKVNWYRHREKLNVKYTATIPNFNAIEETNLSLCWLASARVPQHFGAGIPEDSQPAWIFWSWGSGPCKPPRSSQPSLQDDALQLRNVAEVLVHFKCAQPPRPRPLTVVLSKPDNREMGLIRERFSAECNKW